MSQTTFPQTATETSFPVVTVVGTVRRVFAIGGETTGWAVHVETDFTVQGAVLDRVIDIDPTPAHISLELYESQRLKITGVFEWRQGVERGPYPVIVIQTITKPAKALATLAQPLSTPATPNKSPEAQVKKSLPILAAVTDGQPFPSMISDVEAGKLESLIRRNADVPRVYNMMQNPRFERLEQQLRETFRERWVDINNTRSYLIEKARPLDQERERWAREDEICSRQENDHRIYTVDLQNRINDYEADVRSHDSEVSAYDSALDVYTSECTTTPLPPDAYNACVARKARLDTEYERLNRQKERLDGRRSELQDEINKWQVENTRLIARREELDSWQQDLHSRWEDFKQQQIFPWEQRAAQMSKDLADALSQIP